MSDLIAPAGASSIAWQGHVGMVQQSDRRFVRFFRDMMLNAQASTEAGRPIHEPVDMVEIIHPGERDRHHVRVHEGHKLEFAAKWAAYQAGLQPIIDGTPIETLYPHEPGLVTQFRALHIFTAEQLAGLTEQGISRLGMGGRKHVERAAKFLEVAASTAGATRMQAELDAKTDEIDTLKEQMARMERQLAALAAPKRRRNETADESEEPAA